MSWSTAVLGDVATIERKCIAPTNIASGTRYVGLEHIESGGASLAFGEVSNGELASNKFEFGPHHILFGKLRPYLAKIVCPDFEGICSTDILPILPGNLIDQRYLLHFLRHPKTVDWASGRTTGVNLPRLSPNELASLEIPLPPLDEQRRIAAILDKADALRRKRKRALELLSDTQNALVADCLAATSEIELGDLILEGPTNGLYKPASAYGAGTPILRINNFYDGNVVDLTTLRRLKLEESELTRFRLSVGDIVINRVNSLEYLGKSALIERLHEPTVYESNMMRLSVDSSRMLPEVCIALLQSGDVKRQILSRAKNAVNQSSINQTDVLGLRLLFPSMKQQRKFANAVRSVKSQRQLANLHSDAISHLFASLQHRAFSGQL